MAPPRPKPFSFTSAEGGDSPAVDGPRDLSAKAIPEPQDLELTEPTPSQSSAVAPVKASPPQPAASQPPATRNASTQLQPDMVLDRMAEPAATSGGVFLLASLASLIWAGAVAAFALGFGARNPGFTLSPLTIAFLALIALAPMGLIFSCAIVVAQARVLSAEARRAKRLTDELIGPTALAAAEAGAVVEAMRGQIAVATEVANQAKDHLAALHEALAQETEKLAHATAQASRTAISLVETLSRERGELNTLALTLDARSAAVNDAINRQSNMVAEAYDLAEMTLREAEAALAARTADLAAAAGEAVDASRVASEDLGRQVARMETASTGVGDQLQALEDGLTHQRAALVTVAHALRAEQEDFATLTESRTAALAEFLATARVDVADLNEATSIGAGALSELIGEARSKFRELAEAAGGERDAFAKAAEGTLKDLSEAGAREREHLETAMRSTIEALSAAAVEAREAADVHAEAARARVDLLNEAAFTAGQTADQVFDTRLEQAKGIIEQSAKLVEDAGKEASQRLEAQVAAAREAMDGLNAMMDDVSARAARLPEETGARAGEIKAAVDQGLEDLLGSARRAAEETQAIDQAFQERVRRNYEMLSEAVQLMGVVAQGGGASVLQRASPAERAKSRVAAAAQPPRDAAPPAAAADPAQVEVPAGTEVSLRGRLKLTPTATDDEFKAVFDAAGGQPPSEEGGWTWKELLTTLDGGEGAAGEAVIDDARLGDVLFGEIQAMGIDPAALLPKGRIEEIAAAIQTGDAAGGREVVRTLAPAAIRRLARRLISDGPFRTRVQALTQRFGQLIAEAAKSDKQGFQAAALLATNSGRAFLLLDAASGQQG
ncbi:MAG TPA: polar localization protein TipN [Caulobacteraceae bacterium]|nr:polar localization protein TipN [Caulobacteraceae bacterium]